MEIQLLPLETLQLDIRQEDKGGFVAKYPGAFLLAMGYVAVEQLRRRRPGAGSPAQHALTTAVSFGQHRRHEAESHPLAGLAFFIRPSDDVQAVTIGRSTECHIAIPDESISQLHCQLDVRDDGVYVVDVGSTNGTSINLKQLEVGSPGLVADQDILSVGRYSFQLLSAQTLYSELSLIQAMEDFDQLEE